MNNNSTLVTLLFYFIFSSICFSQKDNYGIQFYQPYDSEIKNCSQCKLAFNQKAKEIKFSIKRENTNLYFQVSDKQWFMTLFKNNTDGLAIDIVDKERYGCGTVVDENLQVRGKLLKPIYSEQLKSGLKSIEKNQFKVLVGRIPENLQDKELEFNILFIGNRTLCRYQTIFNLQAYSWDLLDMGMYLDSLSFENKKIGKIDQGFKMNNKTMRFEIPFQKNKATYEASDIKSLYDSLNLTDFNIETIDIKAYASIEGSQERNLTLQKQRATSIVEALQTYQKPAIKTDVSSAENWVEFLNDIEGTEFAYLKTMSKQEVKEKLTASLSQKMEPILQNHRKAIVSLELIRKDYFESIGENELVSAFNASIGNMNFPQAVKLQNALFNRLKYFEGSPDILDKLEIPEQLNYVQFLNNRSAYKYQLDERRILISKGELEQIKKIDPKNKRVNYNLVAIKFKMWRFRMTEVNQEKFLAEIMNLKNFGVDQNLIERMLINFHIIKSERNMQNRDYDGKDESVEYIYDGYDSLNLSDTDYFSLAQFLAYYSNVTWAAELLSDKVRSIDVDEDLLFYYLNLTLINKNLTKTEEYRTIMLNASTMNKERYCGLFNSIEKNGVTFQLLEDIYLRKGYCEICN